MIHHIAIGTLHPSLLADFYLQLPGAKQSKVHYFESGEIRSIWIQLGAVILMLEKGKNESPKKLVFSLENSNQTAWKEFLTTISVLERTEFTVYFEDPDGNGLGLSSYPQKLPNHWK